MRRRECVNLTGPGARQFTADIVTVETGFHRVKDGSPIIIPKNMSIFVLIAHDQHIGGTQGQVPGVVPGNEVAHVPDETSKLYLEARKCVSV